MLGPEHPHTVTSINNLALILSSQSKYEETENMYGVAVDCFTYDALTLTDL